MFQSSSIAVAVNVTLAAQTHGAPPVQVVMKTGDVINDRAVLSFDMSEIMGQQWAYAPLGESGVWAGVIQQGEGDPEPVRAFALLANGEKGGLVPASIYQDALDPNTSLVSFIPRHYSGEAVHYAQAYTIAEGESFARGATLLAQVGEPTRLVTPETLDWYYPYPPLRTRFTRVTPDGGFVVSWNSPFGSSIEPFAMPFVAGDSGATLVIDDIDLIGSLRDPAHAYYNPDLGLVYDEIQFSESLFLLSPPFDPANDLSTLLDSYGTIPALFGGSIDFDGVGNVASFSNADAFVTFRGDTITLGTLSSGFELIMEDDLVKPGEQLEGFQGAVRAHAPSGSAVFSTPVITEFRILETRSWLLRPAFAPAPLFTHNAPIPGLDPDLLVADVSWYKVSDRGAVLAAVHLAPGGDDRQAFTAVVSRDPSGRFELLAREGEPIAGDPAALGVVESIDTAVPGAPSEQTLTIDGRGLFAVTFESGEQAILSVTLGRGGCAPADLFPDDTLDITDVLSFLSAFDAADPLADLDADQDTDFDDVIAFLESYANGCP